MNQLLTIATGILPYLLSLPSGPAPPGGWPVMVWLHGYAMNPDVGGPIWGGAPQGIRDKFILIAPKPNPNTQPWDKFIWQIYEITKDVQRTRNGNPRKTYLAGFSMGGLGVTQVAMARPNQFWAALLIVDPGPPPFIAGDPGRPVWFANGAGRPRGPEYMRTLKLQPISNNPNSQDRIYVDTGNDHWGATAKTFADEKATNWLLSKQLW